MNILLGQSVGVSTNNILNIDSLENAEVVYALGTSEKVARIPLI